MSLRCLVIMASVATAYAFTSASKASQVVDLGELKDLDTLMKLLGTNASSWEDITAYDNSTELFENPSQIAPGHNGADPVNSLINFPKKDTCHERNGWEKLVCDDMPNHKWQWSSGNAFPIRYDSDKLVKWLEALAKNIKEGKDLRHKWHDGKALGKRRNLGPVASNSSTFRFSVPSNGPPLSARDVASSENDTLKLDIHSHYQYNREVGKISYQGATASFSDKETMFEPKTSYNPSINDKPSQDFTIVLEVWRKSDAMPPKSMSEKCMAKVMRWHIDRASHTQRFACTQIDARGDWWAWYNVNINHGLHLVQTDGACCAN